MVKSYKYKFSDKKLKRSQDLPKTDLLINFAIIAFCFLFMKFFRHESPEVPGWCRKKQ